ncbi:MAG: hypothetical protein WC849_02015 [Candidatus Paceibacterota bacterium]
MSNLLPKKEKELLQKEYFIRLVIVILWLLTGSTLLSIGFMVPSYVVLEVKKNTAEEQINLLNESILNKNSAETEKKSNTIIVKVEVLNKQDKISLANFVNKIIESKPTEVHITDFLYNKVQKKDTADKVITIRGTADERDSLLKFKYDLSKSGLFKEVNLPLSNLTKNEDVDFLVNLTLKEEIKTN